MNPDDIHWEHASFNGKCDREECLGGVSHRMFDEYGADAEALASLCNEHYNKDTQKKMLKRLKASLLKRDCNK